MTTCSLGVLQCAHARAFFVAPAEIVLLYVCVRVIQKDAEFTKNANCGICSDL
jgi:hypothetical protein